MCLKWNKFIIQRSSAAIIQESQEYWLGMWVLLVESIPSLPLANSANLDLSSGNLHYLTCDKEIYLKSLLWEWNKLFHIKHLEQYPTHN